MPTRTPLAEHRLKIVQLNMRRSRTVTLEAQKLLEEKNIDILLMQEPYNIRGRFVGFSSGTTIVSGGNPGDNLMAGIAINNRDITVLKIAHLSDAHCTCVEISGPFGSVYLASIYFQCSHQIEPYLDKIQKIVTELPRQKLIIAADTNAKSTLWHCRYNDDRGDMLEETLSLLDLAVLNEPDNPPTSISHLGTSNIDITMASGPAINLVRNWTVHECWTSSDHNAISFTLSPCNTSPYTICHPRFKTTRANWARFQESFSTEMNRNPAHPTPTTTSLVQNFAETIQSNILAACNSSLKNKRPYGKSVPWWTGELTDMKKRTNKARRAFQSEFDPTRRLDKKAKYRKLRRIYTASIYKTRRESLQNFATEVGNANPWGPVYKLRTGKITPHKALSTPITGPIRLNTWEEAALNLLNLLVPDDSEDTTEAQRERRAFSASPPVSLPAPEFTLSEVQEAISGLKNGKAPGLDRIEVEVVKASFAAAPETFLSLFNACLNTGCFPRIWKTGSIRTLLKGPDRDESCASSYRPICLLPVLGKSFEKLLLNRLRPVLLDPQFSSSRQFGFKQGLSTEDAIIRMKEVAASRPEKYVLAMLFDIKGAFDSVWWPSILSRLKERGCPSNIFGVMTDYLSSRSVKLVDGHREVQKRVTSGCPQGSHLGPGLWNLVFDDLLSTLKSNGFEAFAYADDLLIIIYGNSRAVLQTLGQSAATITHNWCTNEKLELSVKKSELFLIKGKFDIRRPPTIKIGSRSIRMVPTMKYLGVQFDMGMRVNSHVQTVKARCIERFNSLSIVARQKWGLRYNTLRVLYKGLFIPIATYAAAAWHEHLNKTCTQVLLSAQRQVLLKVTKAYNTTSAAAIPVIAGVLPIDLHITLASIRYKFRKGINFSLGEYRFPEHATITPPQRAIPEILYTMWQDRWDASPDGRHTYSIFPNIRHRLEMTWLQPDHYTVQFLSGHGDFSAKLKSLGLAKRNSCSCDEGEKETALHVLLHCPLHEAEREVLRLITLEKNLPWPPNPQQIVTQSTFSALMSTSKSILVKKESAWKTLPKSLRPAPTDPTALAGPSHKAD